MCGILGIATRIGDQPSLDRAALVSLRDRMAHRGPDGAGYWDGGHVRLAHRRLAVVDLSPDAAQPMISPGGAIVYNGELYNDAEVREELARSAPADPRCAPFSDQAARHRSDTWTVLQALNRWGTGALPKLRGMFALAYTAGNRLILARDPLGVKPLYWSRYRAGGRPHVVFASEAPVLAQLPAREPRPDLTTLSAYLTTIRTTLGERTMFDGVACVEPGAVLEFDLSADDLPLVRSHIPWSTPRSSDVRETLVDSIARHLRADVPTCCLLSGGLDSTIICTVARREAGSLNTYCSGARRNTDDHDDLWFASRVANAIGARHTEVPVTREMFSRRWPDMIQRLGMVLSTPNEVAINEVARCLRQAGNIVTLSGEGADELFGGYASPMTQAARFIAGQWTTTDPNPPENSADGGRFQIHDAAWIPLFAKKAVLNAHVIEQTRSDQSLVEWYRSEFARIASSAPDPLSAHLHFTRRVNLSGLLARLDTAAMLEGVEGRTPFADVGVAALAESLPMHRKFVLRSPDDPQTKICLREAFAHDVPADVLARPKASFPLPFDEWVSDQAHALSASEFAREIFSEAAIAMVQAQPGKLWRLAWPMINVALWGRRWWG